MDEEKLVVKGVKILMEKLGVIEANRFISMSADKRLESVKRHNLWQAKLDKNTFFNKVFPK